MEILYQILANMRIIENYSFFKAKVIHKMQHEGHKVVHSLTFHPTETCLITAAADKIYVWRSSPASEDGWIDILLMITKKCNDQVRPATINQWPCWWQTFICHLLILLTILTSQVICQPMLWYIEKETLSKLFVHQL